MGRLIGEARSRAIQKENDAEKQRRTAAEYEQAAAELEEMEERAKLPWGGGYAEQERIRKLREALTELRDEELGEPTYPMEDY